ncbi:MAG: hypothetical protein ABIR15_10410 [Chitinophagaceae bacterium]
MKIITAYSREKNKHIERHANNYLREKQLKLVNHYNSTERDIKAAEHKKIENAFQHGDTLR